MLHVLCLFRLLSPDVLDSAPFTIFLGFSPLPRPDTSAMSKPSDLLAKAQQLQAGDASRTAKRPRGDFSGGAASSSGEPVTQVLERVVRLSLQTAEKAESSACASNLVCIIKTEADQQMLQQQVSLWVNLRPAWQAGSTENKPHELGEKRVFLFVAFLQMLKADADLKDATLQASIDALLDADTADLSRWVASFKPRFSEPKSGRVWVWELAISALTSPEMRKALDHLSAAVDTVRYKIAPHRWGQTGLNKAMWEDLKKLAASRQ